MATEFSFDITSKVDLTEVKNAIDQTEKEIASRYDFRETKSTLELEDNTVKLLSDDEFHLTTLIDILRGKMAKRNISLKALEYGKIEAGSRGTARQTITLRAGHSHRRSQKTGQTHQGRGHQSERADTGRTTARHRQGQGLAASRAKTHPLSGRPALRRRVFQLPVK